MFPTEQITQLFGRRELKWGGKYKYLREFFQSRLNADSALCAYFNGKLKEVYDYRNRFSHDVFAHQPTYDFEVRDLKAFASLLKPLVDTWENNLFMHEVDAMYRLKLEFLVWLKGEASKTA